MDDFKYIGMDVHSATTTIAVRDGGGRLVMEATVATQAAALSDFLRGLRGRLWLTFEEGNWAAWLTQVLTPQVEKLIVCNPRRNASLKQGNKSDPLDARQLAHLLQANLHRPVNHQAAGPQTLQELARDRKSTRLNSSLAYLVCRLLLEKKKNKDTQQKYIYSSVT